MSAKEIERNKYIGSDILYRILEKVAFHGSEYVGLD